MGEKPDYVSYSRTAKYRQLVTRPAALCTAGVLLLLVGFAVWPSILFNSRVQPQRHKVHVSQRISITMPKVPDTSTDGKTLQFEHVGPHRPSILGPYHPEGPGSDGSQTRPQLLNLVADKNYSALCGNLTVSEVAGLIPNNIVYMQRRWQQTKEDWVLSMEWLRQREPRVAKDICARTNKDIRILLYFGAFIHIGMTGLNGSPQGEHIQWHDLYISLLLAGYHPHLVTVPTRLTHELLEQYDLVIIDYFGVARAMDATIRKQHSCKLRILDVYGTDQSYNVKAAGGPFCCLNLNLRQYWTFMPHYSPGNDFLGYAVRSFRPLHDLHLAGPGEQGRQLKRQLKVILYGKDYKFFSGDHGYIEELTRFAPTHATAMGWPQGVLSQVHNHGVLSNPELHALMSKSFVYAGFPAVLVGPAAIEAISQGMVFLNYGLSPPWNLSAREDKPTTQLWHSQFPFLEPYKPHVMTVDVHDTAGLRKQLSEVEKTYQQWWGDGVSNDDNLTTDMQVAGHVFLAKTRGQRVGFVPYEYTAVGMLQRVDSLMQVDLCDKATSIV